MKASLKIRALRGIEDFDKVKGEMKQVSVTEKSTANGKRVVELNIPYSVHIMAIKRDDRYIQPIGSTIIYNDDILFLLADDQESLEKTLNKLNLSDDLNPVI